MSTADLIKARMTALGCERLPSPVVAILRRKVETACEKLASRVVARELTASKISRLLLDEMRKTSQAERGGLKGAVPTSPFDQSDLLVLPLQDETRAVTGTTAANRTYQ